MKRILALTVLLLVALGGSAADAPPADVPPPAATSPSGRIVIGAALASEDSPYIAKLSEYMRKAAGELQVDLVLACADWNVEIQTAQLEELVRQGVDAIILCPVNSKSVLVPLKKIAAAGIPLINLNMRVDAVSSEYIDTYIGASSAEEAALAAEVFVGQFGGGGGKIAIIEGAVGSEPQIFRTQVFIEELTAYPQIEILGMGNGGWDRDRARLVARDLLTRYPDLHGFYCHDSNMALGARAAADELGIDRPLTIVGISEDTEYLLAVQAGDLFALITQPPQFEGAVAVRCAVDAANGKTLRPWYKDPIQIKTLLAHG